MELYKKLCCCLGNEDGSVPYERMPNSVNEVTSVRPGVGRRVNENVGSYEEPDGPMSVGSIPDAPENMKTVAQRESEALNRILQNAQNAVIDVGHLHQGTLGTQQYIDRARDYEEHILAWDRKALEKRNISHTSEKPKPTILDDCKHPADWLGRNTVTTATTAHAVETAARLRRAVEKIKVVPKQELLIDMDF